MTIRKICTVALLGALVPAAPALAQKPAKPPKPAPTGNNTVSLTAKPSPIRFGATTVLSGKVSTSGSSAVAVTLQADPFPYSDAGFVARGTKTSDTNGNFSFTSAPGLHTRYRVVAATTPALTSPVVTVQVAYSIGLIVSDSTPRRGSLVTFRGSVGPRKDGASVRLQRRRSDGTFATVASTTLRPGTTRSLYSLRFRVRSSGTYRTRVAGDSSHLAGTSRERRLTVG